MNKAIIEANPQLHEQFKAFVEAKLSSFNFTHQTSISVNLAEFTDELLKDINPPEFAITPIALLKMQSLVANSSKEIAWHGIMREQNGCYIISDILVYPQTVTAATVDADEDRYGPWLMQQGENLNYIRMQGHSHVNMGVTPSGTDLTYYRDLLVHVEDAYLFLIVNKTGNVHSRFYDKINNILFTDIPIKIALPEGNIDLKAWSEEQIKDQISTHVYNTLPPAKTKIIDPKLGIMEAMIDSHGYPYSHVYREEKYEPK